MSPVRASAAVHVPDVDLANFVGRSRAAQGLGPTITDPTVLAHVANILATGRDNAPRLGGAANNLLTQQSNTTSHAREVSRDSA
jgi:hypothetical protein